MLAGVSEYAGLFRGSEKALVVVDWGSVNGGAGNRRHSLCGAWVKSSGESLSHEMWRDA